MAKNYYVSGGWNCTCDRCGKKKKASEVRLEWTGFIVCSDCFELRHPQDFVRARQDKISVPFTRPRPIDIIPDVPYYTIYVQDGWVDKNYFQEL